MEAVARGSQRVICYQWNKNGSNQKKYLADELLLAEKARALLGKMDSLT